VSKQQKLELIKIKKLKTLQIVLIKSIKDRMDKKIKCSLCNERNVEITMPCAGMHSYCFQCIKKWTTEKNEITCPECRKSCDNFIKLPSGKEEISKELEEFLDSLKIIPSAYYCDCHKNQFDNTCIYPDWTLIQYIDNIDQLILYYENINNPRYSNAMDLITIIKWSIDPDHTSPQHEQGHEHEQGNERDYI
jgi:hypothetical protein